MRIALALSLLAYPVFAAVESEAVSQGVAAFQSAEFEKCIESLGRALGESLTREEKVVTYRTLAFCHSGLGHDAEAKAAFVQLLRVDDKAELDKSVAPKVRALFEEAHAAIATGQTAPVEAPVLPSLHPDIRPQNAKEGQPLSVTLSYPGGSAQTIQMFFRARGQLQYETDRAQLDAEGKTSLTVPGRVVRAPAVELYLTALDPNGVAVARAGGFSEPLTVGVAGPTVRPKRTWVWGVVVGVLVATGTAVGLGVGLTRPTGNADLTIIAPSK